MGRVPPPRLEISKAAYLLAIGLAYRMDVRPGSVVCRSDATSLFDDADFRAASFDMRLKRATHKHSCADRPSLTLAQ